MLGSLRRLCPVTDVSSAHHGRAMLVITRVATPTPPSEAIRRPDEMLRACTSAATPPKLAADRWQRPPWWKAPREVGAAATAAAASAADASATCATLWGSEGVECMRGGAGGVGAACGGCKGWWRPPQRLRPPQALGVF